MPENKAIAGRFKPGQSGNPGGRPKGIAALARQHTDRALEVLVAGMADDDARVRVAAAREVLDRGWGKPVQMSADVTKRLDTFDDAELDAAISVLESIVGSGDAGDAAVRADGETAH